MKGPELTRVSNLLVLSDVAVRVWFSRVAQTISFRLSGCRRHKRFPNDNINRSPVVETILAGPQVACQHVCEAQEANCRQGIGNRAKGSCRSHAPVCKQTRPPGKPSCRGSAISKSCRRPQFRQSSGGSHTFEASSLTLIRVRATYSTTVNDAKRPFVCSSCVNSIVASILTSGCPATTTVGGAM